jgi:hypothetical protein
MNERDGSLSPARQPVDELKRFQRALSKVNWEQYGHAVGEKRCDDPAAAQTKTSWPLQVCDSFAAN